VFVQAVIGPENGPGGESFSLVVIMPSFLEREGLPRWGAAYFL
jgi:hypothetical protein